VLYYDGACCAEVLQKSTVLYCTVLHCTTLDSSCVVLYYAPEYCFVLSQHGSHGSPPFACGVPASRFHHGQKGPLHCITLYCTVLLTVLHCTVPAPTAWVPCPPPPLPCPLRPPPSLCCASRQSPPLTEGRSSSCPLRGRGRTCQGLPDRRRVRPHHQTSRATAGKVYINKYCTVS